VYVCVLRKMKREQTKYLPNNLHWGALNKAIDIIHNQCVGMCHRMYVLGVREEMTLVDWNFGDN
jgi:hypothetical protein